MVGCFKRPNDYFGLLGGAERGEGGGRENSWILTSRQPRDGNGGGGGGGERERESSWTLTSFQPHTVTLGRGEVGGGVLEKERGLGF